MKKTRKNSRKTIVKITQERIKVIEQEYWERYNAGIPLWLVTMYYGVIKLGFTNLGY